MSSKKTDITNLQIAQNGCQTLIKNSRKKVKDLKAELEEKNTNM